MFTTGIQTEQRQDNMGFFSKLTKAAIDTVLLPVDIVKDTVTLGGLNVDEDEPFTVKRARKIKKALDDAYDTLDDD